MIEREILPFLRQKLQEVPESDADRPFANSLLHVVELYSQERSKALDEAPMNPDEAYGMQLGIRLSAFMSKYSPQEAIENLPSRMNDPRDEEWSKFISTFPGKDKALIIRTLKALKRGSFLRTNQIERQEKFPAYAVPKQEPLRQISDIYNFDFSTGRIRGIGPIGTNLLKAAFRPPENDHAGNRII
jgi:hypothetical protein